MLSFEDFTSWRWKTKLCIFAIFCYFTSVKRRTCVKLVKSCVKFTVTMLYKNISANNGLWNSACWWFWFQRRSSVRKAYQGWWENKALIKSNPHYTTRETAETLNIHHLSVHDHIKKLEYVSKFDIWVPHELKEVHLTAHISICDMQKLLELGWDVLPHPPYSPDLAPSDFHLFHSFQNSLRNITFNSDKAINQHLVVMTFPTIQYL